MQTQTSRHMIVTDLTSELPVILADETRLELVLQNLISNDH
jgi:signal transduction histidine kinase